jgi:hypothetical protein
VEPASGGDSAEVEHAEPAAREQQEVARVQVGVDVGAPGLHWLGG